MSRKSLPLNGVPPISIRSYTTLQNIFSHHCYILCRYLTRNILSEACITAYYHHQQTKGKATNHLEKQIISHLSKEFDTLYPTMRLLLSVPLSKLSTDISIFSFRYFQQDTTLHCFYHPSLNTLYLDIIISIINFWISIHQLLKRKKHTIKTKIPQIPLMYTADFKQSVIHKYIEIKHNNKIRKQWHSISPKAHQCFDSTVRNPMNCISNYAIHKDDCKWLKPNEPSIKSMQWIQRNKFQINPYIFDKYENNLKYEYCEIINKYHPDTDKSINDEYSKYVERIKKVYVDWREDTFVEDDWIRLDHINLDDTNISLKCPHCFTLLQCTSLQEDCIAFMCYNFPKCTFPLNSEQYQVKYMWNKVKYIGPIRCHTKDKQDIELASFGFNENRYQEFKGNQDRMWKKLRIRNKYKERAAMKRNQEMMDAEKEDIEHLANNLFRECMETIAQIQKWQTLQEYEMIERVITTKACKLEMLLWIDSQMKNKKNTEVNNKWILKYSDKQNYDTLVKEAVVENMLSIPICVDKSLF